MAKTLASSCKISFHDGVNQIPNQKTNWGQTDSKTLEHYLRKYRAAPGQTKPDAAICEALHSFLFAGRILDAPFTTALDFNPNILLDGQNDAQPLIVNIPWELADSVVRTPQESVRPKRSLAAYPLARTVGGTQSPFRLKKITRLQVLYCISQPTEATPISAEKFWTEITQALQDRSGLLDFRGVEGAFQPRFDRLLGEIASAPPHILIIACHGRTDKHGSSLLFDGWKPVIALADALTTKLNTFLVLLIACDQTYTESPSAQSGALTLLERGIPFVVAMQSSVSALLASTFLGTVIDRLFQKGSIPKSVADGRIQMAPNSTAAEATMDWTFPALFAAENVVDQDFSGFLKGYVPALEHLLRRIPVPSPYFSRVSQEEWIRTTLPAGQHGAKVIKSTSGQTGASSLTRYVCRAALENAIRLGDASSRPILYVDFDPHGRSLINIADLLGILRDETNATLHHLGTSLLDWPAPRGSDGTAQPAAMAELLGYIDRNKVVLVFDNIDAEKSELLTPLIKASASLLYSSLLIVTDKLTSGVLDSENVLTVGPFSLDEVQGYLDKFEPGKASEAKEWYASTGGFPFLLAQKRRTGCTKQGSDATQWQLDESGEILKDMLDRRIGDKARELAYALTHFPNGVDANFAWEFLEQDWRDAEDLVEHNLVLREYKSGQSGFWARLPHMISATITQRFPTQASEAQGKVANAFTRRFEGMTDDQVFDTFQRILTTPGGIGFLHDIHTVLLKAEYSDQARFLPVLIHEWLFEHGRWYDCYRFWKRLLGEAEAKEFQAHEWLKLAKAAHVLGLTSEASSALANARKTDLTALDRVDLISAEAALIKDSANFSRRDELLNMYADALTIIEGALGAPDSDRPSLEAKRAIIYYDRSLVRAFWSRDVAGALEDLSRARTAFESLGKSHMQALADCEWVDVQLKQEANSRVLGDMLEVLFKAEETFATGSNPGDHAFCLYQIGRCYKRLARIHNADRENSRKAAAAYGKSAEEAREAGDLRQESISRAHVIEIRLELGELAANQAQPELERVINSLSIFQDDAWSIRVRRNALLLQAETAGADTAGIRLQILKQAWDIARETRLHTKDRCSTDARRAAQIFVELIRELQRSDSLLDLDKTLMTGKEYVETWLARDVHISNLDIWFGDLMQFCQQPGG